MVPLIISHDGAVHKDTVKRWKEFAPDIKVDWVRIAQSVLRYNVVIVGKFFNKGSWVSESWRKEHPGNIVEQDGPPERMMNVEERREQLRLGLESGSAVCVRSSDTPPPRIVRLTPAEGGNPKIQEEQTNQPI